MQKSDYLPSIFNDVIGPVMRGPSSSHCAASVRIGHLVRNLMHGEIDKVGLVFDRQGSLAKTFESQGAAMGFYAGLLGWIATDARMVNSAATLRERGVQIEIRIQDLHDPHPNTYHIELANSRESHQVTALSIGGGMIEVIGIDEFPVTINGDFYETLIFLSSGAEDLRQYLEQNIKTDDIKLFTSNEEELVEIKGQAFLSETTLEILKHDFPIRSIHKIHPVLPVLSRSKVILPFNTPGELTSYNQTKNLSLWELAVHYESARADYSHEAVIGRMRDIVDIMDQSINDGLNGTRYSDRILGHQSGDFQTALDHKRLLDSGMLNRMILYTSAVMETKSAMGVIVAAPTAGACGVLPGSVFAAAHHQGYQKDHIVQGMLAAGLIGIFISNQATFAAEVGGCQAECGSGSGMAAAALVTIAGGSTQQALDAASMALQNILGLICDPVANRVEVPCLGRNVMAAGNALSSANMALAGFSAVIPLDEVLLAMDSVGSSLPHELRCTGLGGLSVTKTSKDIEKALNKPSGKG